MNLANFEYELVEKIYNYIISNDENKGITLYGDVGCGKSTIALGVAEQLIEGWTIFYIEGIDYNLSPYLTWHIGTKLYSKRKLKLGSEISFGINFQPAPISVEFGLSINNEKTNFILTPIEEAIISNIEKQATAHQKILFIADNFEMWDLPSKQLLQKMLHPKFCLLSEYNINVLIITQNKQNIEVPIVWKCFNVPEIPLESLLFILRENGHAEPIRLEDIRTCSGNDLSLALMAADYYLDGAENKISFNEIMDKRCNNLPAENQEIRKVLGSLSIIETFFSKDEAAFFLDPSSKDAYETEYLAEECLLLAEKQKFIKGESNYHFFNDKIRNYFKIKLEKRECYYHRKFAGFLHKQHPDDYYARGNHLALSLQSTDTKIIIESWQLLLLSYFRRSAKTGTMSDVYKIFDRINNLIDQLDSEIADSQRYVFAEFVNGYKAFTKYDYKGALLHFRAITPSRLVSACLAECQRLILLCNIQLADNLLLIVQAADELYHTIEETDFCEDEQYCRSALVLLDAYIDRTNNPQKVNVLKNKLIRLIQQHYGRPAFDEFEACYNRKAALYYAAIMAYQQTGESVRFYKNHYNRNGIYMSLCNHSGNAIVSGNYKVATQALDECFTMLNDCDGWYYPSQYKIENNRILLQYLIAEKNSAGNKEKILAAAKIALTSLSNIIEHQHDEVSYVVLFNYIGLSALCQTSSWESDLLRANRLLPDLDEFYQYYLHDLNFASALMNGDVVSAKKYLDILNSLEAPLLCHYRPILNKRRLVQKDLLSNNLANSKNSFEYHRIISKECNHIQDDSSYFWGRGFLLSDLQFLSF